jgi:hypothetical protein
MAGKTLIAGAEGNQVLVGPALAASENRVHGRWSNSFANVHFAALFGQRKELFGSEDARPV